MVKKELPGTLVRSFTLHYMCDGMRYRCGGYIMKSVGDVSEQNGHTRHSGNPHRRHEISRNTQRSRIVYQTVNIYESFINNLIIQLINFLLCSVEYGLSTLFQFDFIFPRIYGSTSKSSSGIFGYPGLFIWCQINIYRCGHRRRWWQQGWQQGVGL